MPALALVCGICSQRLPRRWMTENGRVEKISVALTPAMAGMLRGGVASASELMRGALREWKARREDRRGALAALL